MTREQKRLAQMNEESMPSIPEDKMSYAMITIGTSVGHLAAAIYSAVGHGLRALFARTRVSGHPQGLVGVPVRARPRA
jgi:hypothetical protein